MTLMGPLLLAGPSALIRRRERRDDRTDRLEVARAVAEVAKQAGVASRRTDSKLDQIHILVNSEMTARWQAELDRTKTSLVLLRKIRNMSAIAGINDTEEDIAAVEEAEKHIREIEIVLADRQAQTKIGEAEVAAGAINRIERGRS